MAGFNKDFYAPRNEVVVRIIQTATGCFHCRRKGEVVDLKMCTNCRFATYCGVSCQKADWARHKKICKHIKHQTPNNLPRLYAGQGFLDEELLLNEMETYSDLFVEEVARALGDENGDLSLIALCAEDAGKIVRLTVSARFVDAEWKIHEICGVLFKTIDRGDDKLAQIYPADGSHGSIDDSKKGLVVSHMEGFVDRLGEKGIRVVMMTCGRGLTWLAGESDVIGDKLMNIPRMAG
ncbi:hypothetical protein THAOC_36581 [Thalassiosira oceanica]|uniref:MYND-type domain-containing protein n=1 Tax=Thalassiosira oceanica TaxID=159749 RepID=K0R7X5_THAOC|nr:hypothetical protein THAOC_36581 [Thalassiosira oceanica]|eukprot:EJK44846.1 hypothetical protein THAOC_36581 [Thalassiosira oceanica]